MKPDDPAPKVDTSVAHPARRYNYWLGGKDNFAADRESGDAIEAIYPHIRTAAVENRRFLQRVVRHLAADAGIRQFLDIGTGLPTADNTHEVAQAVTSAARIVYVDNDPLVLTHARALLTSHPDGKTAYIDADLRHPEKILTDSALRDTLNLKEPVALLLVAVLHFLPHTEQAYAVVKTLVNALPSGSYVAATHATDELLPAGTAEALTSVSGRGDYTARSRAQFVHFFDGMELLPPGVEVVSRWRPDREDTPPPEHVSVYGGLAVKP